MAEYSQRPPTAQSLVDTSYGNSHGTRFSDQFLGVRFRSTALLAALWQLLTGCLALASALDLPSRVEFNRDIRPILSDNCFYCHGPDAHRRQADLRLDVREVAIESRAIVPNQADESSLIERIFSEDADERMPPVDSHKKLTDQQRALLKLWIEQGAEYQLHWSYEKVVKPQLPDGEPAIDYLVTRQLSDLGLMPSPRADRRTHIRRLYSDLLGLPPSPEAVQTFINDESPQAYASLVDSLLRDPHYGERLALGWLDVVRYADTIGYHSDTPRNVWPYRDWVIRSFNENKPFDRFTLEQIAGDLLPDANPQTRIGSAFNRLLLTTEEGGAQPKDYEARMLTDRVRAVGTAWLGQTTGCAQCHDHKFDPFTSRDFYSLGAFFADIKEPIVGPRESGMLAMSSEQAKQLAELTAAHQQAQREWTELKKEFESVQKTWEESVRRPEARLLELRDDSSASIEEKKAAQAVLAALAVKKRSPQQQQLVIDYFVHKVEPRFETKYVEVKRKEGELTTFHASVPLCLVSESSDQPRTVRILPRGNWMDDSGEVVTAQLPRFFRDSSTSERELNRLDLARWLIARDNPLTARTVMNRLWKQFFGTGISRVLDDLGAQGEPPTNPALLDFLAAEFMDSGWDFRHMVRLIVLSETYQQVSTSTPELVAADPNNRWYARQSAFRIDAELIRDNALAVSGLLNATIGGQSFKPYQPDGYWENLNFPTRDYVADSGPAQYRRGLYVWWQRSFLHPSLLAFDAPSREECVAERNRSNIPQQALVLLNDPTYVEAARGLADRIAKEAGETREERIRWLWLQGLQRQPTSEESEIACELYQRHYEDYLQNPSAAKQLLSVGQTRTAESLSELPSTLAELAAWTHIARVIFNLHEFVTRS